MREAHRADTYDELLEWTSSDEEDLSSDAAVETGSGDGAAVEMTDGAKQEDSEEEEAQDQYRMRRITAKNHLMQTIRKDMATVPKLPLEAF